MERQIENMVQGYATEDGAGVHLIRVLGNRTVKEYDPILMLDSFDSRNPEDYTAGFPLHPHRGIETISYVVSGAMQHKDSLGSTDTITDGEVQWMTAGSGILHEERIPAAERLLGVQLWLNLPARDKMAAPAYHGIHRAEIPEVRLPGGSLRVLAGKYGSTAGFQGKYLPLDYYDLSVDEGAALTIETDPDRDFMFFTLLGSVRVGGKSVKEKTAVRLTRGDRVVFENNGGTARILLMGSVSLQEPVVWGGPIVMNTQSELQQAFEELHNGTFLKNGITYDP